MEHWERQRRMRRRRRYEPADAGADPARDPSPSDPELERESEPVAPRRRRQLTPEQRAIAEARRRVNVKMGFYAHLVPYLSVLAMLLVVAGPRVALIVAMCWGIGVAVHYFFAMVAPDLRHRWVEQEVGRQVTEGVHRERRAIEGRHTRSIEELSASIAHEIRNPITAAKSLVQQMGEDPASSVNVDYAKVALEELDRVERSISHLLRYARDEELSVATIRMDEVVDSALETFRDRLARGGVDVRRDLDATSAIQGDPEKLRRVLINLISNALDAFEEARTPGPRIEVMAGENLAGSEVWVRVRDNGPGIDEQALSKIFNPFYTSKKQGTGLGLALSKKVVDAHGGTLEAESAPGRGTEFVLTLPKQAGAPAGSAS
jgi:signal transduction histidine kinase